MVWALALCVVAFVAAMAGEFTFGAMALAAAFLLSALVSVFGGRSI